MNKDRPITMDDLEIIKDLGKGSFSTVKLVRKKLDGRLLALKEVNMDRLTFAQKNLALNEVRLLASISSPFIVSYHGSFMASKSNTLCLLMEYAEEGDLEAMINLTAKKYKMKQGIQEEFIWRTIIHVLQGLRTMHRSKIAHRDLKSANIFYSKGIAKIGDFNVSTVSQGTFYQTKTGTPYYTAPQIWKGEPYTSNCDIWSLGCIIYQMCSLMPPFKGSNFPELFSLISKGHYCPLSQTYSDQLRTVVRLCLNTNPQERPSAAQLLDNPLITKKQILYQAHSGNKQIVNLIAEIKCPRRIRFINELLPQPTHQEEDEKQQSSSLQKNNKQQLWEQKSSNKIRITKKSQKCISIATHKELNPATNAKSGKNLRLISQPCIPANQDIKGAPKFRNFRLRSQKRIMEKENRGDD